MVFLLTDSEEYRELKCPAVVSIGRGNTNDFRPESQSVSKQHAIITTTAVGSKSDVWLEDLDSRNGTYAGNSPLDLERVKSRRKLYDGDYIRFGHSQKYFRYLERIPVDAEATLPPELLVSPSKELQKQLIIPTDNFTNGYGYGNHNNHLSYPQLPTFNLMPDLGKDGFSFQPRHDFNQPTSPLQQSRPEYMMNKQPSAETMPLLVDYSRPPQQSLDLFAPRNHNNQFSPPDEYRGQNLLANHDHHEGPLTSSVQRAKSSKQPLAHSERHDDSSSDHKNMTISVNYPMSGGRRTHQHPVSITIDPSGNSNNNNNNNNSNKHSRRGRSSRIDEDDIDENEDDEEDGYPDLRRSGGNKRSGATNRYQIDDSSQQQPVLSSSIPRQSSLPLLPQPWNAPFMDQNLLLPISNNPSSGYGERTSPVKYPLSSSSSHIRHDAPRLHEQPRLDSAADRFKTGVLDSEKEVNSRMFRADAAAATKKSRLTPHNLRGGVSTVISAAVRRSWPEMMNAMPSSEVAGRFVDLVTGEEVGTTWANHMANFTTQAAEETAVTGDGIRRVRGKKHSVGKAAELVLDIPDSVVSEVVAESLSVDQHSDSTAGILNTVVRELNDLLRQCLQGSQIVSTHDGREAQEDKNGSAEFDHVLKGVVAQAVQDTATTLSRLTSSSLLQALQDADSDGSCPNKIAAYVQQSLDTLSRVKAFMLGSFLTEEARSLRTETVYEIVSLSLSSALDRLDACSVAVHTIVKRAEGDAVQHENKHLPAGAFRAGASSLSVELEELRRLRRDSELTPWLERIRQQEAGVLEKKMSRFYRVFDIALRHQLHAAVHHWRLNVHALKRRELKIFDLTDRHVVRFKQSYFDLWSKLWKMRVHKRKALQRFGRVIGTRGKDQVRRHFRLWEKAVQQSRVAGRTSEEVAALKYEMCNLKATLHDMTGKNEVAANLAAERALNRELSAVNLELRASLQHMEDKLLEVTGAAASKRKDLVFQHLIGKEEELAEARRESAFLLSELEVLSTINDKQQQSGSGGRSRSSQGAPQSERNNSSPENHDVSKVEAFRRAQNAKSRMVGLPGGPSRPGGGGGGNDSIVMTKDIARQVVLNEVRRMQQALSVNKQSNAQLNQKMQEEVTKNIQHGLATLQLQSRLTAIERSAASLRELLRQRLGDVGVMELVESLDRLGAGPAALLEVPANPSRDDPDHLQQAAGGGRMNSASSSGGSDSSPSNSVRPDRNRVSPTTNRSDYYVHPVNRATFLPSTTSMEARSDYNKAIDKHIYK